MAELVPKIGSPTWTSTWRWVFPAQAEDEEEPNPTAPCKMSNGPLNAQSPTLLLFGWAMNVFIFISWDRWTYQEYRLSLYRPADRRNCFFKKNTYLELSYQLIWQLSFELLRSSTILRSWERNTEKYKIFIIRSQETEQMEEEKEADYCG